MGSLRYWYILTFLFVFIVFFFYSTNSHCKNGWVNLYYYYQYYYYYYYRYYYYYYYYYCLGFPETAFPKWLTVFPRKITTNITDVESNILLVRSTHQIKWYIAEAVTNQTCNIQSLQIYKVCNSRVTCWCSWISPFFHFFFHFL